MGSGSKENFIHVHTHTYHFILIHLQEKTHEAKEATNCFRIAIRIEFKFQKSLQTHIEFETGQMYE